MSVSYTHLTFHVLHILSRFQYQMFKSKWGVKGNLIINLIIPKPCNRFIHAQDTGQIKLYSFHGIIIRNRPNYNIIVMLDIADSTVEFDKLQPFLVQGGKMFDF